MKLTIGTTEYSVTRTDSAMWPYRIQGERGSDYALLRQRGQAGHLVVFTLRGLAPSPSKIHGYQLFTDKSGALVPVR